MQEGNVAGSSYFYTVDSAESNIGKTARRRYYGIELQTAFDFPFANSKLRTEYIRGDQPGSSSSSRTPRSRPEDAIYDRPLEGAHAVFIQELGNSPVDAMITYDSNDLNKLK